MYVCMYAPHAAPSNHHCCRGEPQLKKKRHKRRTDGIVHYMYIQGVEHTHTSPASGTRITLTLARIWKRRPCLIGTC